jgi:RNA polymerase sigma-70 factor (ECF subfamily)
VRVAEIDPADRRALLSAAYRMLGTMADAEDAVQEAYVRLLRLDPAERDDIRSPAAWLMRTTARICLDMLGSARARRERYVGDWLPEPVPADHWPVGAQSDPVDVSARAESVSTALLLMLETLTPAGRRSGPPRRLRDAVRRDRDSRRSHAGGMPSARCLGASAGGVPPRRPVPAERHRAVVAAFSARRRPADSRRSCALAPTSSSAPTVAASSLRRGAAAPIGRAVPSRHRRQAPDRSV